MRSWSASGANRSSARPSPKQSATRASTRGGRTSKRCYAAKPRNSIARLAFRWPGRAACISPTGRKPMPRARSTAGLACCADTRSGYAAEEVIAKSITILIPAELHDEEPKILAHVRRGDSLDHYETIRQRKDGSRFPVSLSVSPVKDAHGTIVGASKIARDITARKQAEHERDRIEGELRELSEKLEQEVERRTLERDRIWNVSEDLLGVANFAGYFLSMNPAWSRLLGWSEDEIKAMHVTELRHPDDAAHSEAGRKQLAQGVPTVRMENRLRHKDGSWRWLHWTMTEHDGLIYVAGRHVTAEKESAAALQHPQRQATH